MNRTYTGNYFFILSKGNNAGKPLEKPCPNCFVIINKDQHENELLFWLCYGLWQAGYFLPCLVGSVIPFIRISEVKQILLQMRSSLDTSLDESIRLVDALKKLHAYQNNITSQLQLIKHTKQCLMRRLCTDLVR